MQQLWIALISVTAAACAATQVKDPRMARYREPLPVAAQGWIGMSEFQSDEFDDGSQLPTIGGVYQQPFGGTQQASAGLEGGLAIEWDGSVESFRAGGGGLIITTDNDLLLSNAFIGPYGEVVLGERWRIYGAAGGILEFVNCDADIDDPNVGQFTVDDEGIGGGVYARTGLEFVLPSGVSLGFGVRWVDSSVDFDDPLGEYDLERVQWLFTATTKM